MTEEQYPNTLAEALDFLMDKLSEENLQKIKTMSEHDLIILHFSFGLWVRHNLGLRKNPALVEDIARFEYPAMRHPSIHIDSASSVIIRELWHLLQDEQHS